jgi:hypothetical protein
MIVNTSQINSLNNTTESLKSTSEAAEIAKEKAKIAAQNVKKKTEEVKEKAKLANQKAKEAAEKAKSRVENAKNKLDEVKNLLPNADNYKNLISPSNILNNPDIGEKVINLLLPLLSQFINIDKINNIILDKLIRTIKNKLEKKGRVEIIDKTKIIFTPNSNIGNETSAEYELYIQSKVDKLRKNVAFLNNLVKTIIILLEVLRVVLSILQLRKKISLNKRLTQALASSPELASPSPVKINTAVYILAVEKELRDLQNGDKIDKLSKIINYVKSILILFRRILGEFIIKLDSISFTISNSSQTTFGATEVNQSVENEETYTFNNRTYTLKIIEPIPGFRQAVAYDSFSKMKITQTAPSKSRTNPELLDELKQIIG